MTIKVGDKFKARYDVPYSGVEVVYTDPVVDDKVTVRLASDNGNRPQLESFPISFLNRNYEKIVPFFEKGERYGFSHSTTYTYKIREVFEESTTKQNYAVAERYRDGVFTYGTTLDVSDFLKMVKVEE